MRRYTVRNVAGSFVGMVLADNKREALTSAVKKYSKGNFLYTSKDLVVNDR